MAFALLFACSCEDNTDTYVEQLYTNAQKEAAFSACLHSSLDSAFSHLCVHNGFYQYNDAAYRIDFSNLRNSVFDTLSNHQLEYLADSLIICTNRMAESCNASVLSDIFKNAISSMTYYDHDALINGDSTAITEYFKKFKYTEVKSAMQSPVSIRMNLFRVNEYWNSIMNEYNSYSNVPVNINLQDYVVEKMLDGIFKEMSLEEINIRMDSTHRVKEDSLLGRDL